MISRQLFVSCGSVRDLGPAWPTPPGAATPSCLTSRLTSPNRGQNSRMATAVKSPLHAMPTTTRRHLSPSVVTFDCTRS